jgi:hypothetical protein
MGLFLGFRLDHKNDRMKQEWDAGMSANGSLQACPFCGSTRLETRLYNQPSVVCLQCLAMGPGARRLTKESNVAELKIEAEALWNARLGGYVKKTGRVYGAAIKRVREYFAAHEMGSALDAGDRQLRFLMAAMRRKGELVLVQRGISGRPAVYRRSAKLRVQNAE